MRGDSLDDLLTEKPVRELRYAGFGIRAAAFIIDNLISGLLTIAIAEVFALSGIVVWLLVQVCVFIFEAATIFLTPGKLILGLEVISENIEEITAMQVIQRSVLKYLPVLFMALGVLGTIMFYVGSATWLFSFVDCISALDDVKSRTYHDRIAGTSVVYKIK